jgi:epoxyqueuosine reductase QueG
MQTQNIEELQSNLKIWAREWGADLVGFCALSDAQTPLAKDFPAYTHAISLAVKLSDGVLKTIENGPSFMYFQHYRTANALLDNIAFRLARKIEEWGYLALPVAASQSLGKQNPYRGVVPHKTIAALSGLGFVGKSGLFLTTEYGSKVRFATILTTLPVESELPVIENGCGECTICQKACPAGAIFGTLPTKDSERNYDPEKCSKYMKEHFQEIGRGSVCGICIKVCPKNKLY